MYNPIRQIKLYIQHRRWMKNAMLLMLNSGTVRKADVEIRYGKTRSGRSVRSVAQSTM